MHLPTNLSWMGFASDVSRRPLMREFILSRVCGVSRLSFRRRYVDQLHTASRSTSAPSIWCVKQQALKQDVQEGPLRPLVVRVQGRCPKVQGVQGHASTKQEPSSQYINRTYCAAYSIESGPTFGYLEPHGHGNYFV